jgi:CDP-diacylglycerol pyrophosphatase
MEGGLTEADKERSFFYAEYWYIEDGVNTTITNWEWPKMPYKLAHPHLAKIETRVEADGTGTKITLTTDVPAFFVHLESDRVKRFSDSSFVLLPGTEKVVTCDEAITTEELTIYQLAQVGA